MAKGHRSFGPDGGVILWSAPSRGLSLGHGSADCSVFVRQQARAAF